MCHVLKNIGLAHIELLQWVYSAKKHCVAANWRQYLHLTPFLFFSIYGTAGEGLFLVFFLAFNGSFRGVGRATPNE